MRRFWDWVVAVTMIAIAIFAGGVIAALISIPVTFGIGAMLKLENMGSGWAIVSWIVVFALLQGAGFYDYYWRKSINYATGKAGVFHLIPRAIERARSGHEFRNAVDGDTGKPVDLQAPVRAGRHALVGTFLTLGSIGAVLYAAPRKGEWTLVITALGFIGVVIGIVILAQVWLAYAGFIDRE